MEEQQITTAIVVSSSELVQTEVTEALASIREVFPTITDKTFQRYVAAGFVGEKLTLALDLANRHKSSLPHIVRWNQKLRLSMPRIKLCLGIRDEYGMSNMSVSLISRYLNQLGFSELNPEEVEEIPESVMEVFATFMEIAERLGGDYPVHRVWHRIEEEFGANIQEAYHMAIENERIFLKIMDGKMSREVAVREARQSEAKTYGSSDDFVPFEDTIFSLLDDSRTSRDIERLVRDAGDF